MRNIVITDGTNTVYLLPDIEFTIEPRDVGVEATMASGKTIMDIVGTKNVLEVPTGWLSPENLLTLRDMIRSKHVLTVTYPDIDGPKTSDFVVKQPKYKAFKYGDDGVTQWYGVTLTMTQQGVD